MATSKLTREQQKDKALQLSQAREKTFTLVSKIISWKTASRDSSSMQSRDKITQQEWSAYKKHLLTISKTESTEVVKAKIESIQVAIEKHQGFE